MKLKLATADFAFPLLSYDKVLQLIALLEFNGVDIGLFEGRSHLWPSREFKSPMRSAKKLKRKLDDLGLKAADIFLQMAPDFVPYAINHPEPRRRHKARDWFSRALDYAAACGARHVTTLPGVTFDVEQSKKHRITFGFEAHVGSIVPKPKLAEQLVKAVAGATLTLDYTHFTRLGMPDSAIEPLLKYASHFHVRGARKGRLQAAFRDNTIDYRRVCRRMKQIGYRGWIGIEYVWIDWEHCNECDNVSETIRYRDFFRKLAEK